MKANCIILAALAPIACVHQLSSYIKFDLYHPISALPIVQKYLPKNPVIVEAGAYDGQESISMAKAWPDGIVYSFEPVPELYQRVVTNTHSFANIKTYPLALSNSIGKAQFHLSEMANQTNVLAGSSSLLAPKEHLAYAPLIAFNKIIEVSTTTLDAWAKEHKVEKVDCLWLDMQGTELYAMMAAPKIMKTVKVILTEVEFVEAYKGQPLYRDVKTWLEKQGFQMVAIDVDPHHPEHWFGDALFVRI